MKKYIRDNRSPKPSSAAASKIMSSIRAKNTKPELIIRKLIWNKGYKGYRLHAKKIIGRPDIAFLNKRTAIFVHGCFWHRCPNCDLPLPKSNSQFWLAKFKLNTERDKKKEQLLKENGWTVFVFWECQIKSNPENLVKQLIDHLAHS